MSILLSTVSTRRRRLRLAERVPGRASLRRIGSPSARRAANGPICSISCVWSDSRRGWQRWCEVARRPSGRVGDGGSRRVRVDGDALELRGRYRPGRAARRAPARWHIAFHALAGAGEHGIHGPGVRRVVTRGSGVGGGLGVRTRAGRGQPGEVGEEQEPREQLPCQSQLRFVRANGSLTAPASIGAAGRVPLYKATPRCLTAPAGPRPGRSRARGRDRRAH